LAEKSPNVEKFKKSLEENGAEMTDSLMSNLYRIVRELKSSKDAAGKTEIHPFMTTKDKKLRQTFPGLCIPDKPEIRMKYDGDGIEKPEVSDQDKKIVDDTMALLESLAPGPGKIEPEVKA
jgi:hypothetical protein